MGQFESDAAILAACVDEPARFSEFYERHLSIVAGYVARRVGPDLADDLVAEVFVRAFRARCRFEQRHGSAVPWLLGIANHLVADNRRAERRQLALLSRLAGDAGGGSAWIDSRASIDPELARQLRRLPAGDRDALLLTVWGELSYDEVAMALGVPIGTVRSRIFRARKRLATALRLGDEGPAASRPRATRGGARA